MTSATPRLQRIADLQQRARDRAAASLVTARKGVQVAQGQLCELQRYAEEYDARPLAQSVWQIQARRAFAERLSAARQQQQQRIARAERQALQAQLDFQRAHTQAQSLSRAAECQRQQLQHDRDRRQQASDDDRSLGTVVAWAAGG